MINSRKLGLLLALALPLLVGTSPADNDMTGMGDMGDLQMAQHDHSGVADSMSGIRGKLMENMIKYHMKFTAERPATPDDKKKADDIIAQLKAGIEKYKDYKEALKDGYKIFHPERAQPRYHFTNNWFSLKSAFKFDPAKPTSLLYTKKGDGYELIGAMYTAPKRFTEDRLNERVPLSIGHWHQHTNICIPPGFRQNPKAADWTRFGPGGSIGTKEECDANNGYFLPVIYGWMIHVYPYEKTPDRVWAHDPMTDPD